MVSCSGLSWRPKVLIIFLSPMQEWRGDYVGMVLYLDDQHGVLRLQVAALRVSHQVDGFVTLRTKIARGTDRKRSPIRTTFSVHTGGELRCLGRSPPRAVAHIRGLLLIL
jgi:hypothetical protein